MNTIGLWYRVWAVGGVILLLGGAAVVLHISLWSNKTKREKAHEKKKFKTDLIVYSIILLIELTVTICFLYKAIHPNIECYTGSYEYSQRTSRVAPPLPLTSEYVFYNEGDKYKQGFYIDVISRKRIFPEELVEGTNYRVWFDKETKVILKIEAID